LTRELDDRLEAERSVEVDVKVGFGEALEELEGELVGTGICHR
jgi:hypothetical protein